MGTRENHLSEAVLTEAVLMCTHNLCFEQKQEKNNNFLMKFFYIYSRKKSTYIAWAIFRNGCGHSGARTKLINGFSTKPN